MDGNEGRNKKDENDNSNRYMYIKHDNNNSVIISVINSAHGVHIVIVSTLL